jgi:hypothetical protein
MRTLSFSALFLASMVACAPATSQIGKDGADGDDEADTDTDTDSDTDADTDTDTDADLCSVEGRAYAMDLANARWVEPPGVGSLIGGLLDEMPVMGITAVNGSQLDSVVGLPSDPECITFPTANLASYPFFRIGPEDAQFSVSGTSVTAVGLQITGVFASDCGSIEDGAFLGQLDMRELAFLLGTEDAAEACEQLVGFGVLCSACGDGAETCVNFEATDTPTFETAPLSCQ